MRRIGQVTARGQAPEVNEERRGREIKITLRLFEKTGQRCATGLGLFGIIPGELMMTEWGGQRFCDRTDLSNLNWDLSQHVTSSLRRFPLTGLRLKDSPAWLRNNKSARRWCGRVMHFSPRHRMIGRSRVAFERCGEPSLVTRLHYKSGGGGGGGI